MQQNSKSGPIGSLFIPIMVHLGVSFLVSILASAIVTGSMAPELINSKIDSTEVIMQLTNELMKYTTEITTISAMLSLPIFVWMFRKDQKLRKNMGIVERETAKTWMYGGVVVLSIVACIALNNLITLSNLAFYSDLYAETAEALYATSFPLQVIGLGIMVPITEEVLFRGVLYNRLIGMMTKKKAMIWSAVIFGVYHGNLVQALYGGILGFLLVYLYEKYGSLKAPILAHIVLNMTSLIITEMGGFTWMFAQPIRVGIITAICAGLSASMFLLMQRIESEIQ